LSRLGAILAAILVVVAAAAALLLAGADPVAVVPNSVAVIDADGGRVVLTVPVGIRPGPVAVGAGSVWVGNLDDRTLTRIDLATRRVVKTIALPATPTAIAYGAGAVWVAHGQTGQVSQVDPQFETVTTTRLGGTTLYFSGGGVDVGGSVWVAYGDATLARVSPADGRETGSALTEAGPAAVAVEGDSMWVSNTGAATVQQFHASSFESGPVETITVGRRPMGLAVWGGSVWVASAGDDALTRIDIGTRSSLTIAVGDGPTAVAAGLGAIWVANMGDGTVWEIDPATNEVVGELDVGGATAGLVVADGLLWVAVQEP
jgi:DNA-binding beta-propeller fold protein YncE